MEHKILHPLDTATSQVIRDIYSIRLKIFVSLTFFSLFQNNCHFRILMQHLLLFSIIKPLFIEFHST